MFFHLRHIYTYNRSTFSNSIVRDHQIVKILDITNRRLMSYVAKHRLSTNDMNNPGTIELDRGASISSKPTADLHGYVERDA